MPNWVKGLDIAFSRAGRPWWYARYQEGYRVCVQNLWTGGYGNNDRLREVAAPNLADALAENFVIAGYANANPWYPPVQCVNEARLNAGPIWDVLRIVAEDVELPEVTETQIQGLCLALEATGKTVPFYSAAWFWKDTLGNPTWPWLKTHKIWEAYYDGDPDVDFPLRRFGPWELTDVVGEQYQGTTVIDGVDVDLNAFDLDYWGNTMPTPAEVANWQAFTEGKMTEMVYWEDLEKALLPLTQRLRRMEACWRSGPEYEPLDWTYYREGLAPECDAAIAALQSLRTRAR